MKTKIEVIARVLIVQDDRVLLCENRKHGYRFLPGGHVEFGESAQVAAARECLEEFGVAARVEGVCAVAEQIFEQSGKPRHEYTIVFRASLPPGAKVVSRETKIEFVWVDVAELGQARLMPPDLITMIRDHSTPGCAWRSIGQAGSTTTSDGSTER